MPKTKSKVPISSKVKLVDRQQNVSYIANNLISTPEITENMPINQKIIKHGVKLASNGSSNQDNNFYFQLRFSGQHKRKATEIQHHSDNILHRVSTESIQISESSEAEVSRRCLEPIPGVWKPNNLENFETSQLNVKE